MRSPKINEREFVYQLPDKKSFDNFQTLFGNYLNKFSRDIKIARSSFAHYEVLVDEICKQLDKRKDYNLYFHHDKKNSDSVRTKETALMCYWIIKYKPLFQSNDDTSALFKKWNCTINELFAVYVIKTWIYEIYSKKGRIERFFTEDNDKEMIYNFMHREISKESMIMYVNSIYNALTKIND